MGSSFCCSPTSEFPCCPENPDSELPCDDVRNLNVCECEEPFPGSTDANYCLMDNYKRRGGNNIEGGSVWNVYPPIYGEFTLNELCIDDNHDQDGDTHQSNIPGHGGESCWDTIAGHPLRALQAPSGLPEDAGPPVPEVTFDTLPSDTSRFVLVLDRSGSMGRLDVVLGATRLERVVQAAEVFINLARDGDELGIISFSSGTRTEYPLTPMMDSGPNTRQQAKDSLNDLTPGGRTDIGRALVDGANLISPLPDSCNQPIVLLTDGFSNTGDDPLSKIPELLEAHIPVTTIAIGAKTNEAKLKTIAARTSGRFYHPTTYSKIRDMGLDAAWIGAEVQCEGVIDGVGGQAPGGGGLHEFEVDGLTGRVTFVLLWNNPDAALTLELIAPDGTFIFRDNADTLPEVEFLDGLWQEVYKVRPVQPGTFLLEGTWQARVIPEAPAQTDYNLMVLVV